MHSISGQSLFYYDYIRYATRACMVELLVVCRMVQNTVFGSPDCGGTASVQIQRITHASPDSYQSTFGQCRAVSMILRTPVDGHEIIISAVVLSYQCPRMTGIAELLVRSEHRYVAILDKQRT